ncbi:unnamed protein product [Parnassius apollo]|uniref:(apollo) hypothetical protein n=1 Tax=Parnassius apollo TaxID=110799 RepID=A0A8S3X8V3_PARAO|nr:unnamed protein product [Parnassius apollo]
MNYPDESGSRLSGTLSHILDPGKITDSQTSEKLRGKTNNIVLENEQQSKTSSTCDFYNRLIQTDARIKKLKKETEELNVYSSAGDISMKPISDRYKRSLMSINSPLYSPPERRESDYSDKIDLNKFNLFYPPFVALKEYKEVSTPTRIKRAEGEVYDDEPSGIVIEKKKVMVQYGPFDRKRNFPKCSHSPKESKSHEKQLKHPFYKNSQRLDELLDQLLDKNMDTIIANPFELDVLVSRKDKCKHSKQDEAVTAKNDQEVQKQVSARATKTTVSETISKSTEFKRRSIGYDSKSGLIDKEPPHKYEDKKGYGYAFLSTTPLYDIVLSVSTLINSESTESINVLTDDAGTHQSKRKLLQFNEEDNENLGYEDFKEVLSDYMDTHDEIDKQVERDRRSDNVVIPGKQKSNQNDIPSVHNPNWKGPMPLYPDELNLIKHAVVHNPKNEGSEDLEEMLAQKEKLESQITNNEYIEDYLNNKYDKLAQAYSDYGVLADKKESVTNEKNLATESKILDNKVVALTEKDENIKNLPSKGKKNAKLLSPEHEGIQFNLNNETQLKSSFNISGILSQHLKYLDDKTNQTVPYYYEPNNFKKVRADPNIFDENIGFTVLRKQRSLKSVETEDLKQTKTEPLGDNIKNDVSSIVPLIQSDASKYNTKTLRNDSVKKISYEQRDALNSSHSKSSSDSSELLHVLSDWFLTLAKLSGEYKDDVQIPGYNFTPKFDQSTSMPENITNEIMYPMYDADMIENIGHRSRVLMSFDENYVHVSNTSTNKTTVMEQKTSEITQGNIDTIKHQPFINDTKLKKHISKPSNETNSLSDNKENKTVVKRCAGDSNLLFWNDIYDDEYGVKIDYLDSEMRNKHSADGNNFVKRSGQWINKKFKKFGDSIRTGYNSGKYWRRRTTKKRSFRSIKDYRVRDLKQKKMSRQLSENAIAQILEDCSDSESEEKQ